MFLSLVGTSLFLVASTWGASTISAWFPIFGDGELWIDTFKPMEASIVAIVMKMNHAVKQLLTMAGWNHYDIGITVCPCDHIRLELR
jgi:hypothetical protein